MEQKQMLQKSPLEDQLLDAGATMYEYQGWLLPSYFSGFEPEYVALTGGVAVADRSNHGRIEHRGADALDLLNRFSTNELTSIADGQARATVLTSDRGRVAELFTVMRRSSDHLLLLTSPQNVRKLIDWIDRYTFDEDSTMTDITISTAQVAIAGPGAAGVVARIAGDAAASLQPMEHVRCETGGLPFEVIRTDAPGLPCYELIGAESDAALVWRAAVGAGATPIGALAWDAVRIEHGVPVFGSELTEEVNPLEANLMPFINFEKGCYMGQEVVARLDTYDKVQRRLVGLLCDGSLVPGEPLMVDSRQVGRVTSVSNSPALNRRVALGYVRKEHVAPGTRLAAGSGTVQVAALPLVEQR